MKRNWKLLVCLLMAMMLLTACSGKPDPEDFPDITQAIGPTATPTAAPAVTYPCQGKDGTCRYITYSAEDPFCRACDRNENGVEDSAE